MFCAPIRNPSAQKRTTGAVFKFLYIKLINYISIYIYISLIQWLSNVASVRGDIRKAPAKHLGNSLAPTLACAEAEWDSTSRSTWLEDNLVQNINNKLFLHLRINIYIYMNINYQPPRVLVDYALSRGAKYRNHELGNTSEGRGQLAIASSKHNRRQCPLCVYIWWKRIFINSV